MAKATETKSFTMADFAKKLNREYNNNNLVIKSDVVPVYKRLSSGMMGMDYPLYGGLPYGRMMVYAGLEHSGKTTAACAMIAAYFSSEKEKPQVAVDYTKARYVKKPSGSKPGFVIYEKNYTAYVTADKETVENLEK